ncbi:MAG TPA: L,D-transpeptidase [Verrucomicrobiae bacterium]|nr:L,D-transpeptidase [Verrucomicrobiae bacterium]
MLGTVVVLTSLLVIPVDEIASAPVVVKSPKSPAIVKSVPVRKGGFLYDSHPVPFKVGPPVPFRPRSRDWVMVDLSEKTAWQFRGTKVLWACEVSVGGKGHAQLKGWNRIRDVKYKKDWYPTDNTRRMMKKVGVTLPDMVPGGDPRNALGLWYWEFQSPLAGHGNNNPGYIGGYTRGCIQFGNKDIELMTQTGVGEGDYVFVQA